MPAVVISCAFLRGHFLYRFYYVMHASSFSKFQMRMNLDPFASVKQTSLAYIGLCTHMSDSANKTEVLKTHTQPNYNKT